MAPENSPKTQSPEAYDQVPYPSRPTALSHPSAIAALGRVFRLQPPPPSQCRVLEIGCASGGNLIPMAQDYPDSQFVGFDLSGQQIARGQRMVDALRLTNLCLFQANILELDNRLGDFDYIICHGVYSWVPSDVQAAILRTGRERLSDNGLMYVSYNTYPGWRMRGVVREMMQYHVAKFASPRDQIDQARNLLAFLGRSADHQSESFGTLLKEEAKLLSRVDDSYLFHEHLEANNTPLYFHEFANRVASSGLGYVGDANLETMVTDDFDESTRATLIDASFLEQEQYMDFLRGRMFRRSLLCHLDAPLNRQIDVRCLVGMHLRIVEAMSHCEDAETGETKFVGESKRLSTNSDVAKCLIQVLVDAFPNWKVTDHLVAEIVEFSSVSVTPDWLLRELTRLICRGFVVPRLEPPSFVTKISNCPMTTPLVRWQVQQKQPFVSSRLHESVSVRDDDRHLLSKLDGDATIEHLRKEAAAASHSNDWLDERLAYFAYHSLLVG